MRAQDNNDGRRNNDDRGQNYHSFDGNGLNSDYRGFSTSINDMFIEPDLERIDCCALACCGVLQSDRNRYLTTGIKPPGCGRRFWLHFVFPCWIFSLAMFCALKVPDPFLNGTLSTTFVFCLVGYFIIQCLKGTWKRQDVRKDLLWSKQHQISTGRFQLRHEDGDLAEDDDSHDSTEYLMGQTAFDIRNSHGLCGCYKSDRPANYRLADSSKQSLCSKIFHYFTNCCCGTMCGMHLQLCGICGVAQEGRQLEMMLPDGYKQIDYITMQPVMEYYPAIYDARHGEQNSSSWRQRISKLSESILVFVAATSAFLLVWTCMSPILHHNFGLASFLIFCATIFQAVGLLTLIYWKHMQDISMDALIKYFASGFCLSTSLAMTFELVIGLSIRFTMRSLIAMSGIDVVEENGFSFTNSGFASLLSMDATRSTAATYKEYIRTYGKDHPVMYAFYLLITSFLLAAMIEELCKYFGYRMVDHPDFYSRSKLVETAKYQGNGDQARLKFENQDPSLSSRGAAITIAMVATALGFACCENLVYVFIYGGSTPGAQLGVLFARSLLPVHPIAAALQSIRVCQRDLEKDDSMQVGRIILPAVILHGLYDFLLMWIDFMYELKGNYVVDDDAPFTKEKNADIVSVSVSFLILLVGAWYYLRASRLQRERLKVLDRDEASAGSRLI